MPARGGLISEGRKYARALMAHQQDAIAEILLGVGSGANTIGRLVSRIYKGLSSPAGSVLAAKTVEAHLENLIARGEVATRRGPFGAYYERIAAPVVESENA